MEKKSHGVTSPLVHSAPKREATRTIVSTICGAFLFYHMYCAYVCVFFKFMNHQTEFHWVYCQHYAIGVKPENSYNLNSDL